MNREPAITAHIRNSWPRPGITASSAEGIGLVGRFVSDSDVWRIDSVSSGQSTDGRGDPLGALRGFLDELRPTAPLAGAIGYVSYEWGGRQLGLTRPGHGALDWMIPEIQFQVFERLIHPSPQPVDACTPQVQSYTRLDLDSIIAHEGISTVVSKARYMSDVRVIKEHIAIGDIYQANYTQALEMTTHTPPEQTQELLRSALASPYSAFLKFDSCSLETGTVPRTFPDIAIISFSPERFWRKRGRLLDSRPIKGTIGRGTTPDDDAARRRRLLESSKDRAELLMITDLVRNDLGQVADIGSVKTDSLLRVRPTPSVWHLESTVSAQLSQERSWCDVMSALSPAGSISGTPKHRAVEILSSLEPVKRGPYCGAIGWVNANGDADFAVGIRTLMQSGNRIRIHGGGGIVADSDPEAEYYESLIKIAPLIEILSAQTNESKRPGSLRHA